MAFTEEQQAELDKEDSKRVKEYIEPGSGGTDRRNTPTAAAEWKYVRLPVAIAWAPSPSIMTWWSTSPRV